MRSRKPFSALALVLVLAPALPAVAAPLVLISAGN